MWLWGHRKLHGVDFPVEWHDFEGPETNTLNCSGSDHEATSHELLQGEFTGVVCVQLLHNDLVQPQVTGLDNIHLHSREE